MGITLTETFLANTRSIGIYFGDQHLVVTAMQRLMRKTIRKIQAIYTKDLLYKLQERRMGTPDVFNLATRLAGNNKRQRDAIVAMTMKTKIRDAWNEMRKERHEERILWRELETTLRSRGKTEEYNEAWSREKSHHFERLRLKRKEKLYWIKQKYYKKKDPPDEYKGVIIKDQELGPHFNAEPVSYGGITLSEPEKATLRIHPKYTVFEKVDPIDTEAEIEKCLTKIRWARHEEEREKARQRDGVQRQEKKETFNVETKTFDFREARSTELPFNCRVQMPKQVKQEEEVRLQNLKQDLTAIVETFADNKETETSNLTVEQKRGLKRLQKRKNDKEVVVFQTDKSGKLAIDSMENYKETAAPHVEGDEVVTIKEYEDAEKLINAHSAFWMKMLQVAKDSGDARRYKSSMKKEHTKPPTLYTFRKDHKTLEDPEKGPPVRPLCDVSDSYGHKLSHFISRILKEISDEAPTTCDSTEDMMAAIKEANDSGRIGAETVIGSLDVKALYPSLDLDFTIEKVADEFLESEVKIDGVDDEELGLYLSLHRTEGQLREKGLLNFCPRRRNAVGAPPKITASGTKVKKEERFQPWIRTMGTPDERNRRVMLREAMVIVLTVIMKNHVYSFNNVLRRQKEGGAIGMDITGELADVFMVWWDKEILKKMRSSAMDPALYKRYKDDINTAVDQVPEGTVYMDGSVVRAHESQRTTSSDPDERTFAIIQDMGNAIHTSIQLTKDVPSANEDSKVPILDLKCWTDQMTTEDGRVKC